MPKKESPEESVLNIILFGCHVCMHRTLLHSILQNIPQSNVLVIFCCCSFVRFQPLSFILLLLLSFSFSSAPARSIFLFHFLFFETLTAPNNIVNRTKSEDNNIIDTKCMGLRLNSIFFRLVGTVWVSVCCHETSSSKHCEIPFSDMDGVREEEREREWEVRMAVVVGGRIYSFVHESRESPSICTVGIPNIYSIDTISLRLFLFNLIVFDLFSAHVFSSHFFFFFFFFAFTCTHARTLAHTFIHAHIYTHFHVFPYIILSSWWENQHRIVFT